MDVPNSNKQEQPKKQIKIKVKQFSLHHTCHNSTKSLVTKLFGLMQTVSYRLKQKFVLCVKVWIRACQSIKLQVYDIQRAAAAATWSLTWAKCQSAEIRVYFIMEALAIIAEISVVI